MFTRAGNGIGSVTRIIATLVGSGALLAACGGGGGGGSAPPPTLSVGGTVVGLNGGSIVLRNNGANDLTVTANGAFTFSNSIANGATYSVAVATQPASPAQTCTVANGSGNASAAVTNITVTCTTNTYNLGGTVSGLTGAGLVLANGTTNLPVAASGPFTFPSAIPSGTAYNVTVGTQPAGQTCSVANGGGTIAAAAVTNVAVTCSTNNYTVSGTITGLTGANMVLQLNGGNDLARPANSTNFAFPAISATAPYAVTVSSQPNTPSQTCTVANGAGTGGTNVTNVAVTCATNTYAINVNVTGLTGTGLVLRNNGTQSLNVAAPGGTSSFATPIVSGGTYAVTVLTQPTGPVQNCTVANGTGTVTNAAVTVNVTCSVSSFTVGGTVSGLTGTGLQLKNNNGTALSVAANGAFTFPTAVASGGAYAVTVFAQPTTPAQTCTLTNATGTVGSGNVTNVAVSCSTTTFTVGGSVTGLPAGTSLVLQNNAGDDKTVNVNGNFTFTTGVADAGAYAVTVLTQPTWNPATSTSAPRTCDVRTGSGNVTGANVTSVKVVCRSRYSLVANRSGDARLTNYSIGSTGALTGVDFETVQSALEPTVSETDAQTVATTPTLTHAFVAVDAGLSYDVAPYPNLFTTTPGHIRVYEVAANGQMTFASDVTVPNMAPNNLASDPMQILVHPGMNVSEDGANRRRVYVVDMSNHAGSGNESIHEYSFNYSLATLTRQGGVSVPTISGAEMDPLGEFIWATTYTAHAIVPLQISASTGALTPLAATVVGTQASEMFTAIDPTGSLLFVSHKQDAKIYVYEINRSTGALVLKDTKDTFTSPELTTPVVALLVNPASPPGAGVLYAARSNGDIQTYAITSPSSGVYNITLTSTTTRTLVNNAHVLFRMAIDKAGQFLYHVDYHTTGDIGIFRINQTTGALDTAPTLFLPPDGSGGATGTMGVALP